MLLLKAWKSGDEQTRGPTFYPIYAIFERKGNPSIYLL